MHDLIFTIGPGIILICALACCAASWCPSSKAGKALAWLCFLGLCAMAWTSWDQVHRLPVYGLFEGSLHMALILSLCLVLGLFSRDFRDRTGILAWGHGLIACLMVLALTVPGHFNPDFYMYQALQVQLFFALRLTAGGILLWASLLFLAAWVPRRFGSKENGAEGIRPAISALILGSIFFLSSELSGTIWCMQGWGDTWHWSRNFFESAGMFLLLMLPLHLPFWSRRNTIRAVTGTFCSLAVVLLIMTP